MLVLSRKLGERIMIGHDVWVTIVDIRHGKVRLGIEAPRELSIHRQKNLPLPPDPPAKESTPCDEAS